MEDAPRTATRAALGALGRAALAIAAPAALAVALLPWVFPGLLAALDTRLPVAVGEPLAADGQGTLWFYGWVADALGRGVDVTRPDTLCAPSGTTLGLAFPNRVDAVLAAPLMRSLPMPRAYNVAVLGSFVLGVVGAALLFGRLTRLRPVAWALGAAFAFNVYAVMEVGMGRPVTALTAWIPLFLWAWLGALEASTRRAPWGWAALAGALGGLTVHAYLPFALFSSAAGLVAAALRAARPAEGVTRGRPLQVGLLTLGVSGALAAVYAHEILVVRAGAAAAVRWPWDPALWTELAAVATAAPSMFAPPVGAAPVAALPWPSVQGESLPWDYLWTARAVENRSVWAPAGFVAASVALGAAGGRRGAAWLGAAAVAWLVTLGPTLTEWRPEKGYRALVYEGRRFALPVAWLLDLWPPAAEWLRPLRAYPYVLLGLCAAACTGLDRLGAGSAARRWAAVGAAAALVAFTLHRTAADGGYTLRLHAFTVPPFLRALGEDPEPYAIAELPAGLGHATGPYQLVHRKRRSEGPTDLLGRDAPPPDGCFRLPFTAALRALGRPGGESTVAAGLAPTAIAGARDAGYRYVIFYRAFRGSPGRRGLDEAEARARLDPALGPPVHEDADTLAWALPDAGAGRAPRSAPAGAEAGPSAPP